MRTCRSRGSRRRGSRGAALLAHAVGSMARGVDGSRRVDVAGAASSIFRQVMAGPRMRRASSCRSQHGRRSPGSLRGLGGRDVLSWRSWSDAGGVARCMSTSHLLAERRIDGDAPTSCRPRAGASVDDAVGP